MYKGQNESQKSPVYSERPFVVSFWAVGTSTLWLVAIVGGMSDDFSDHNVEELWQISWLRVASFMNLIRVKEYFPSTNTFRAVLLGSLV